MKLKYFLFFSLVVCLSAARVKPLSKDKIEWITLAEAEKKVKLEHKPVLIDLYTDWCHWCKVMDKETYENKALIDYINDKYYAVRLNAETRDTLRWMGQSFAFNPQYKINMFTLYVTDNQPSFPSTIILADDKTAPISMSGFMKPGELELMVKYIGEGAYKTKGFQEYQHTFHSTW